MFSVFQILLLISFTMILFFVLGFIGLSIFYMVRIAHGTRNFAKVPGHPIIENYHLFTNLEGLLDGLTKKIQKYGKFVKINLFIGMSAILVADLNFIEYLLGTTKILNKSIQYLFIYRWLGEGLLTCQAEKWRKTRKIITPAFHFQILEHYVNNFHLAGKILVAKLRDHVGPSTFDVYPYVTLCTLDVICESAMGTKINAQANSTSEYVKAVRELCRILIDRTTSPIKIFPTYFLTQDYRAERRCVKIVHDYTDMVIKRRRQELQNENIDFTNLPKGTRLAFLDLLLQAKIDDRLMTDDEIRQEVDTFMFAGHDTTSSGISFTLYCLSVNQDVQDKVFEELTNIFGDDRTRAPTMQDLQSMSYLERVIKETLRLYPPVPIFGRTPFTDEKYYGGIIPTYSQLMILPYAIHRDPEIYPEPEKFDPDRFLPENQAKRHPFSYLAFSAGPRNCIGQRFAIFELKSVISHLLRNFEIKPAPNYKPQPIPLAVLKSSNGILIRLENRQ